MDSVKWLGFTVEKQYRESKHKASSALVRADGVVFSLLLESAHNLQSAEFRFSKPAHEE